MTEEGGSLGASPFDLVDHGDGPVQAGIAAGVVKLQRTKTYVLVGMPPELSGDQVAEYDGLWEPAVGATIKLGTPNRDAKVYAVSYEVRGNEIASFVYVHDPQTHPKRTRPMVATT
ncbi:MAG: hypothetical protein M3198_18415 [Actinomycetota bacterium]|nr:hypothetical protein [Actinomycetota bacterium]